MENQTTTKDGQQEKQEKEIRLVDVPVKDENIALNLMVGFLHLAHKRGIFSIDESAKIWECISKFQQKP
jgi:hypothetical protein